MEQAHDTARRPVAQVTIVHASNRDPEKEQAALRLALSAAVLLAYACLEWRAPSRGTNAAMHALAFYAAYGTAAWFAVNRAILPRAGRLAFTTIADQALLLAVLGAGGAAALPMLWAVFLFLIGSGCRYGRRMLMLSCSTALAGVAALATFEPWWMANRPAALGVALSIFGASVYLNLLVDRLGTANRNLARQAGTDPLTGLSNRLALEHAIGRAVGGTRARPNAGLQAGPRSEPRTGLQAEPRTGATALLLIDLDGFKEVNDTYGHAVGDVLLQTFAELLSRRVRKTDTVARLGGDEFVVLTRDAADQKDVQAIADTIHGVLAALLTVQDHPVSVSASIGACLIADNGQTPFADIAALMRAADRAMYRAKTLGRGRTEFAVRRDFELGAEDRPAFQPDRPR